LGLEREVGKDVLAESLAMERKQIEKAIKTHQQAEEILPEEMVIPKETKISVGDVIYLGNHTLKCGDSLHDSSWFAGSDLVLTDPPYNVGYNYSGYEDRLDDSQYREFIFRFVTLCTSLSPFVIITPGKVNEKYYYSLFNIVDSACWFKGFSLTNGIVSNVMVTEPILFLGKKPLNKFLHTDHLAYNTDREPGLLEEHSCPKPLGLWKELITTFTDIGGTVYDPFGGSGTTIIACELTDRIAYVQELDPMYCEAICQRWERLTGKVREIGKSEP
jgi:DNA modification methylase